MTGVLTNDLLCVRGCQTEATGVVTVVDVVVTVAVGFVVAATVSVVTFLGVSTAVKTLVVVETTTGGVTVPLTVCGGGGCLDLWTVGVTLALFRLFEGTEELRPRFSFCSSVVVVVDLGGG